MRFKLFVYGTLKRGFCNHHLLAKAQFLSEARTKLAYPLIAPKKWYPYLIDAPTWGKRVKGELYLIDLATFKRIDRLEEYPRYYTKKVIEVVDSAGKIHRAWTYFLAKRIPHRGYRYLEEFVAKEE